MPPRVSPTPIYLQSMDLSVCSCLTPSRYSEAIAVLYGTNRFHIQRECFTTVESLQVAFLPQRLASITAVDIFWTQVGPLYTIRDHRPLYTSLWDGIFLMTNLRSLRLNLVMGKLYTNPLSPDSSEEEKRVIEREWLGPPDELVQRLGSQLEEFVLLVAHSLYDVLQRLGNEEEVPSGYYENMMCFTRVVGGYEYVINEWPDFAHYQMYWAIIKQKGLPW